MHELGILGARFDGARRGDDAGVAVRVNRHDEYGDLTAGHHIVEPDVELGRLRADVYR